MVNIALYQAVLGRHISQADTLSQAFKDRIWPNEDLTEDTDPIELLKLTHDELCELCGLLASTATRQISSTHRHVWGLAAEIAYGEFLNDKFQTEVQHWAGSFAALLDVQLARPLNPIGGRDEEILSLRRAYAAPPLAFALLEGTLRRINSADVTLEGVARHGFSIAGRSGPFKANARVNRVSWQLRILEQRTWTAEPVLLAALQAHDRAVQSLSPDVAQAPSGPSAFDTIDAWRNHFVHGASFWNRRSTLLTNLVALLIIARARAEYGQNVSRMCGAPEKLKYFPLERFVSGRRRQAGLAR